MSDYQNNKEINNKDKVVVDIVPLSKWKRILLFLSDYFINFFIAFFLFNVLILPLGKVFTNFSSKNNIYEQAVVDSHEILYQNKIVFVSPSYSKDEIDLNIEYTFDCWLSYYTLDTSDSIDLSNPQFGHRLENEIFVHFYDNIRNDSSEYISLFNVYNEENSYFDINEDVITLKDNVKNALYSYFDPSDEMGDIGSNFYKSIKNKVYLSMLSEVFLDIENNDLTYNSLSYIELTKTIKNIISYHDTLISISSLISLIMSWIICFVVIPFTNKNHKTISMLMMRVEKINVVRLYILKKKEVLFSSLYNLLANISIIFFLPVAYVSFNHLFSIQILFVLSLISLFFAIVSFFFVMFNEYNRSLSDLLSNSLVIPKDKLDEIYRARGYNI